MMVVMMGEGMEVAEMVEVGPTEDTVFALLELLVDPLLPSKASALETPTPSQEVAVAKQMHSVVLLYNYYHRKWNPQLEFLEFDSFCKLCVIFKPSLLSYLKLMRAANYDELDVMDKKQSSTEEMMMDACNISRSLDASKDVPLIEGKPITKLAVFLVDSQKENCLLLHSSVTQGVWSLIEKDVDVPNQNSGISSESTAGKKRVIKKPQKVYQTTDGTALKQVALAAAASVCGLTKGDISILENHNTYSLSKENAAICLYIMQCMQPIHGTEMLPIKDVMQSLQGPLVRKECGTWSSTAVVEYFHLLPYAWFLSDWLSRVSIPSTSQICNTGLEAKEVDSSLMNEVQRETRVYKKRSTSQKNCNSGNNHVNEVVHSTEANSRSKDIAFGVGALPDNMDVDESAVVSSSADDKERRLPEENHVADLKKMIVSADADSPAQSNGAIVPVPALVLEKLARYENGEEKDSSENNALRSMLPEQDGVQDQTLGTYNSRFKQADKVQQTIASKDNVLTQTALKVLFRKREILSQQIRGVEDELAVCNRNIQAILSGGEDDLAVKIDSIIEGCNDVFLQNVASVQDKNSQYLQYPGFPPHKRSKRLSEANLFLQNSCQELDGICYENNWILPRYHLSISDGGFRAEVTVKGADVEHSCEGDLCSSPRAARESAATQVLARMRKLAMSH